LKPVKEAKKYAKTLISVVGIDEAPRALSELMTVDQLMAKSSEFRSLMVSPVFPHADRERAFKSVAEKLKLSDKVYKFLVHITRIKAVAALPEIITMATQIYLEKKNRAKATVMTPVELTKDHESRLKASLKKRIDKDVDIEFVIDPSLLGGVLVKVGSTMYDSSIKGQLRLLKEDLIKG